MAEPSVFGRRLRAFRERAGLSQRKLGELSGVPRVSISRVESGQQEALTVDGARRVADVLHILIDDLVRGDRLAEDDEAHSRLMAI